MNDHIVDQNNRAVTIPLQQHKRFESDDFHHLRDELGRTGDPHQVNLLEPDVPIDAQMNTVKLGNIDLKAMRVGPRMEVDCKPFYDYYLVHMPLTGSTHFNVGRQTFSAHAGRAAIFSPGMKVKANWDRDCSAILLRINKHILNNHLGGLLGCEITEDVQFQPMLNLDEPGVAPWERLWKYIINDLECSINDPTASLRLQEADRMLMTTLLSCVKNNYTEQISVLLAAQKDIPMCLAKAKSYIERVARDRPSVGEVAEAASVSTRTLHQAFVRYVGMPPKQAILIERLRGAKMDLEQRTPGVSVTEIATKWGFYELGRFAKQYRERFGELPSETLK